MSIMFLDGINDNPIGVERKEFIFAVTIISAIIGAFLYDNWVQSKSKKAS